MVDKVIIHQNFVLVKTQKRAAERFGSMHKTVLKREKTVGIGRGRFADFDESLRLCACFGRKISCRKKISANFQKTIGRTEIIQYNI